MSAEFWAILAVGVALAGLQWRMHVSLSAGLNGRMDRIEARIESRLASFDTRLAGFEARLAAIEKGQARIEGWIAGRFREEIAPTG